MGSGGRGSVRVLVLTGSETGSTHKEMARVVKKWVAQDASISFSDVMEGHAAVSKMTDLQALPTNYDVVLVVTSSYGEGEPPYSIESLFKTLKKASLGEEKPLAGMQHAVLGFGSSIYDTFQNCPRLIDRYLGESGSRRMVMRAELDECHDSNLA
eukprot:6347087-Prymnesium_polylepis.3